VDGLHIKMFGYDRFGCRIFLAHIWCGLGVKSICRSDPTKSGNLYFCGKNAARFYIQTLDH
jgi:hypothetical protein